MRFRRRRRKKTRHIKDSDNFEWMNMRTAESIADEWLLAFFWMTTKVLTKRCRNDALHGQKQSVFIDMAWLDAERWTPFFWICVHELGWLLVFFVGMASPSIVSSTSGIAFFMNMASPSMSLSKCTIVGFLLDDEKSVGETMPERCSTWFKTIGLHWYGMAWCRTMDTFIWDLRPWVGVVFGFLRGHGLSEHRECYQWYCFLHGHGISQHVSL